MKEKHLIYISSSFICVGLLWAAYLNWVHFDDLMTPHQKFDAYWPASVLSTIGLIIFMISDKFERR